MVEPTNHTYDGVCTRETTKKHLFEILCEKEKRVQKIETSKNFKTQDEEGVQKIIRILLEFVTERIHTTEQ